MIQRENDGVRWELQPDFAPFLDALLKSPGQMVKESPVKQVTVHQVGEKTFYIKRYLHHAVPLRSWKFYFKATQARQEWDLAQQLEARKIPIVRHVALGERRTWSGVQESILVTEGFDGVTLTMAPDVNLPAVLEFVEAMHEHGVLQTDLHPGNMLVSREPFELRLVDLHGTRVVSRISPKERRENLAKLRMFLSIPVSDEITALSHRLRQEFFQERSLRWIRRNRDFGQESHGGLQWRVRLPLLNKAVLMVLRDPDLFLSSRAHIIKPGRSSTVGKADGLVLKRFNFRKVESLIKDLFRPSRASRAFQSAYHLELLKIATARPIAAADRHRWGFLRRSYLLTEEIHGGIDLGAFLRAGREPEPTLIQQAARLIAKLHDEGFSHRDLKESNLIIGSDGRIYVIDLDGLKFLKTVSNHRSATDLERLLRGVNRHPVVTRRHRVLFLLGYCRARKLRTIPRAD